MDAEPIIDLPTLEGWITKSEHQLGAARQALADAQGHVRDLEEKLEALRKLRPPEPHLSGGREAGTTSTERSQAIAQLPPVRQEIVARTVQLLEEAGHPLPIRDIHQAFQERGWRIGGEGKPVNIIFALRQSNGLIVAPRRGVYALPEQVDAPSQPCPSPPQP